MKFDSENFPQRPAWTEIDLGKLRRNLQLVRADLPPHVRLMAVVKDEAYGHGALDVARVAVEEGAWGFGLSTLEEAMALRDTGILLYGVFPSTVCRQLPGIEPVMSVKARIAAIQKLKPGEVVGYGMRYTAKTERRIAILPIGYGDGFPRVRNEGCALIHGRRAPLVGGIAMDALMVDITDIPQAQLWDEAVLMGKQGSDEITVRDIAKLKNSVTYDVLTNWRLRLRRKSVNGHHKSAHPMETATAK